MPAMAAPRVSVIMIFLDAAEFITEAIESVLAQSFTDFELILVDDGSRDASTQIAQHHAERSRAIRYVDHAGHANRGMSASRNLGLGVARGELIAFLDADDLWLPQKLGEQVRILGEHPAVALIAGSIHCQGRRQNGVGHAEIDVVRKTGHVQDRVITPPAALRTLFPIGPFEPPPLSDILITRQAIERVGGFEEQFPGYGEDCAFLTKILIVFPAYFSSRQWTVYRVHPGSYLARMLADGTGREQLYKVLHWIAYYLRDQPNLPRSIRRKVARRILVNRLLSSVRLRRLVRGLVPPVTRTRLRSALRWLETAVVRG